LDYRSGLGDSISLPAREFFATFSRFEFALKRGGFLRGQVGEAASPDWNRFASALGLAFYEAMKADSRAAIFFLAPPKKLVVTGQDKTEFQSTAAITNSQQLFDALRLIRNNLFHGEKANVDDRDRALIGAALFVLDRAFEAAAQRSDCKKMTGAFAYTAINPH
jgi:hypothetical protein